MALTDDLGRIAAAAAGHARTGEAVAGVIAAEPADGRRLYLCAYEDEAAGRAWLALDDVGEPVVERSAVREAVSIAAMCEAAVDIAAGGDLEELRLQLVALRLRENPPGIEEAEEAAIELERTLGAPPRLASPGYLDDLGLATRRLERALGDEGASPFVEAMKGALGIVQALTQEVEERYKQQLR